MVEVHFIFSLEDPMSITTTFVMTDETRVLLKEASEKTGKEAGILIEKALELLILHHKNLRNLKGAVEYQKRIDEEKGVPIVKYRVKVKIDENIFGKAQYMRVFYLKSISLLIALAVKMYIDLIVVHFLANFCREVSDNFLSNLFTKREFCAEESTLLTIWWGEKPENSEDYRL